MELIINASNLSHMKSLKFIPINGNELKTNTTPEAREKSAVTILYICHPTLEILLEL